MGKMGGGCSEESERRCKGTVAAGRWTSEAVRPSVPGQSENRHGFRYRLGWFSAGCLMAFGWRRRFFRAPQADHPTSQWGSQKQPASWLSVWGPQPSGRFFPELLNDDISEHFFSREEGENNRLFERDCLNIAFPPAGFVLPAEKVGGGEVTKPGCVSLESRPRREWRCASGASLTAGPPR